MKSIIVGTAGHIDHGKTALVKALTGIDTDRLEEEKRRGISIDLGFAHLDLSPAIRAGFVDVPGHERFVKNMLAGAGGIDLVLLVIAADESIKPQTREHFDICRLLGIRHGIVVLTKADLVDPDVLGLARLEAEEFVAGSFLEGAPIVAASAVTGAGLEELRARLLDLAAAIPAKDSSRYFRLPIDRAFSVHGFGTVVTGTLVSGSLAPDQEVELAPSGRRVRVRGVQSHGSATAQALAGQRTAVNLAGIDHTEIRRGMVLTEPGRFRAVTRIDCTLELLPAARPLKPRAPVHFHAGTAEVEAELRRREGPYARIVLREPLLLLPGDRFVIRRFSPVVTIGGGVVVDTTGRRFAPERLRVLEQGTPAQRIALLVRESPYGLGLADLIASTGLMQSEIEQAGQFALDSHFIDRDWLQAKLASIENTLRAFHQNKPLAPGMPKEDLRAKELPRAPAFLLDALLSRAPSIAQDGDTVRLATHKVVLKEEEEKASETIEKLFLEAGLAVPPVNEALKKSGLEPARARTLLQMLLRQKKLVRIGDDLVFHRAALETLRSNLAPHKGERLTVPQFKDLAGVSRKYAIPLLEYLDRERLTRREGDTRLVL